jgi:hypothetical protein
MSRAGARAQADYSVAHGAAAGSPLDAYPELQQSLLSGIKRVIQRGRPERRAEVQRARDQRLYFRGDQNLAWDEDAGEVRFGSDVEGGDGPNRRVFNIIQGYGKSFISTFCQARPKVRAEADDPFNPRQIVAAEKAESYRRVFEKNNDVMALTMEVARLMWTDGRVVSDTYFDGEKEMVDLYGVLESRVLITAKTKQESPVVQVEREYPLCWMKAKYPEARDKISSEEGDSYDRNARLAVMRLKGSDTELGVAGSDTLGMATRTKSFVRPEAYYELNDTDCEQLQEMFPRGLCVVHNGTTYLESMECDVDERIDILLPMPGDGQSRTSIGSPGMNLQDSYNEFMNLAEETFERGLGRTWLDQNAVNGDGLRDQDDAPGSVMMIQRKAGEPVGAHVWQEPGLNPSPQLVGYLENLAGPMSQFATGQQPSLYGAGMENHNTASAYAQSKNMALGLMAIVWKPFVSWYARVVTQAVTAAWNNRTSDIAGSVPANRPGGQPELMRINPRELPGASFTVAGDDNFPESYTEKSQKFMALLQMGVSNPVLAPMLAQPDNLAFAKQMLGLEELVIPQADSRNKQLAEIAEMQNQRPMPNPALPVMAARAAAHGVAVTVSGHVAAPVGAPAGTGLPLLVSSVAIDPEFDDHATEYTECVRWINSPEGQAARVQYPDWFADVRLHALAHKAAMQAQQAGNAPEKADDRPRVQINYTDLPVPGQVQAAAAAGIQLNPADAAAQQADKQQQQAISRQQQAISQQQAAVRQGLQAHKLVQQAQKLQTQERT